MTCCCRHASLPASLPCLPAAPRALNPKPQPPPSLPMQLVVVGGEAAAASPLIHLRLAASAAAAAGVAGDAAAGDELLQRVADACLQVCVRGGGVGGGEQGRLPRGSSIPIAACCLCPCALRSEQRHPSSSTPHQPPNPGPLPPRSVAACCHLLSCLLAASPLSAITLILGPPPPPPGPLLPQPTPPPPGLPAARRRAVLHRQVQQAGAQQAAALTAGGGQRRAHARAAGHGGGGAAGGLQAGAAVQLREECPPGGTRVCARHPRSARQAPLGGGVPATSAAPAWQRWGPCHVSAAPPGSSAGPG